MLAWLPLQCQDLGVARLAVPCSALCHCAPQSHSCPSSCSSPTTHGSNSPGHWTLPGFNNILVTFSSSNVTNPSAETAPVPVGQHSRGGPE